MKIIRAENLEDFKKEEKPIYYEKQTEKEELIDDNTIVPDKGDVYDEYYETQKEELIDDRTKLLMLTSKETSVPAILDDLMQKVIDENKIKVEITLTKRQHGLWIKKGGEKWLKKMLQH